MESSISPIQLIRENLEVERCAVEGLGQATLSASVERFSLYNPPALTDANISGETGCCSIELPELETVDFSFNTLKGVTITFQTQPSITPGIRVEKMGTYGRKGRVLEIRGDYALVDWGYSQTSHPLYELYPLNESGNPIIPGKPANIFQVARQGREAFAVRSEPISAPPKHSQIELF